MIYHILRSASLSEASHFFVRFASALIVFLLSPHLAIIAIVAIIFIIAIVAIVFIVAIIAIELLSSY
jgi:hypothetical protein